MAFSLNKKELAQRDEHVSELRAAAEALTAAVEAYREAVVDLKEPVEEARAAYNEVLERAQAWVADIVSEADSAISDKSEKWQEGEKGQAASSWKDAWEQLDMEEVRIDYPDELEFDEPTHADDLEQAPEDAEG